MAAIISEVSNGIFVLVVLVVAAADDNGDDGVPGSTFNTRLIPSLAGGAFRFLDVVVVFLGEGVTAAGGFSVECAGLDDDDGGDDDKTRVAVDSRRRDDRLVGLLTVRFGDMTAGIFGIRQ